MKPAVQQIHPDGSIPDVLWCYSAILPRYRDRRPTDPFFYPTTVSPLTGLGLNLIEESTPPKPQVDMAPRVLDDLRSPMKPNSFADLEDMSVLQRQNDELAKHMQDLERAKSLAAMTSAQALQKIRQRQEQLRKEQQLCMVRSKEIQADYSPGAGLVTWSPGHVVAAGSYSQARGVCGARYQSPQWQWPQSPLETEHFCGATHRLGRTSSAVAASETPRDAARGGAGTNGDAADYYGLLGLPPYTADKKEIKAAHRRTVKLVHPDILGPDSGDLQAIVNTAYRTLSDDDQRSTYETWPNLATSRWANPKMSEGLFVDETVCRGCLKCATAAPGTFEVDPLTRNRDLLGGPAYAPALDVLEQEFGRVERDHFDSLTLSKGRGKGKNMLPVAPAAAAPHAAAPPAAVVAAPPVAGVGQGRWQRQRAIVRADKFVSARAQRRRVGMAMGAVQRIRFVNALSGNHLVTEPGLSDRKPQQGFCLRESLWLPLFLQPLRLRLRSQPLEDVYLLYGDQVLSVFVMTGHLESAHGGQLRSVRTPFYTRGKSDADHLALRNVLDRLSPNTAEACNRMGVALSEAGGTINMMADFVDRYLSDPVKCLQKLGLDHLAADMDRSKAKQLRAAAQVFDRNFSGDKPKLSLAEAAAAWVDYFSTDGKEKATSWQRLARSSAIQFVFAMEMLQWFALGKDPKAWADKVKTRKDLQPDEVQKWLRGPSSKERLENALRASYLAQAVSRSGSASGSASGRSSSPPAKKDKKDSKKDKKESKKDKKTRDRSEKKSSKKDKKTSKDKDKKKSRKEKKSKDKNSRGSTKSSGSRRPSSSSSSPLSAKAPKKFSPKLLKEVDEGTRLEVDGKAHNELLLASFFGACACRLAANEAKLGEGLYDDYVKFEVDSEATRAKVVFVVDIAGGKTRVWAAEGAGMDDMRPVFLRHGGFHFTALTLQTSDVAAALAELPPIEGFSFVGPAELLAALMKAQKYRRGSLRTDLGAHKVRSQQEQTTQGRLHEVRGALRDRCMCTGPVLLAQLLLFCSEIFKLGFWPTFALAILSSFQMPQPFLIQPNTDKMATSWADLSPTNLDDNRSRLHPALRPNVLPDPPAAPRLGPAEEPQLQAVFGDLPPADEGGRFRDAAPAAEMAAGLSPRLLWTLFVTWRARWAPWVGISRPGMDLLAAYVRIYIFQEEPVAILVRLQQLLAMLLPATAIGPRCLWEMIFW
eukprot:s242_g6.t1